MSVLIATQERDRAQVAEQYTWNLADIYPDLAAWVSVKDSLKAGLAAIRTFAGRLGESPQTLADALETKTRLEKQLARLYVYASMLADQDTRVSESQGMQQEMQRIAVFRQSRENRPIKPLRLIEAARPMRRLGAPEGFGKARLIGIGHARL